VNVAAEGREWKFLGDCTRDDCLTLVDNRRRKASELETEAERYQRVADAMAEYGAETVRQLPREALREVLAK
jgi:hypothetical protein